MCFLYSIFSKKNKEKGFSLLELLVAMGIAGSVSLLVTSISDINLRNLVSARMSMDEQQLYASLSKTIGDVDSCKGNLKPKAGNPPQTGSKEGVYGTNHANGIGDVEELYIFSSPTQKTGTPVIKIGDFGTNLKIIKMSLEDTDNSHHKPTSTNNQDPTKLEDRVFKVYYNHRKGNLKKSDSTCKSATPEGCYSMVCDMAPYEMGSGLGVNKCIATCQLITRPTSGGGSGTVDCYKVEGDATNPGVTAVGCGTTQANTNTTTTALGYNAGKASTNAVENTFIGHSTGSSISTGGYNTFVGADAGEDNTTGESNTFLGYQAGYNTTTGIQNVFIGRGAGFSNSEDDTNTSRDYEKEASMNTYIGMNAGRNNTSSRNSIFIGYNSGISSSGGQGNTFIGSDSGKVNTGGDNVFVGIQSGQNNQGASSNTFVGAYSGSGNRTGAGNVFVGRDAGLHNTTANNTFIGTYSGKANTTGGGNTFIGRSAGVANTTGDDNVFIGKEAGEGNTTGDDNVFIGKKAGRGNRKGNRNILIGKEAGEVLNYGAGDGETDTDKGHNNIFIGHEASKTNGGGVSKEENHQLNIGNLIFGKMPSSPPASTIDFFAGNVNSKHNYLQESGNALVINGNLYVKGKAFANCGNDDGECGPWSTSDSSRVYKKNITPFLDFNKALTDITTTPLFTYEYKEDHPDHQRMGIIAEDLPPHLQIKDQYEPVKPDWVSIYGTFWASIKALFNKVTNLTKSILRLNSITSSLKVNLYEVKEKLEDLHGVKDRLEVLEKETQLLKNKNNFLTKQNKILKKQIKSQDKTIKALSKKMEVSQ